MPELRRTAGHSVLVVVMLAVGRSESHAQMQVPTHPYGVAYAEATTTCGDGILTRSQEEPQFPALPSPAMKKQFAGLFPLEAGYRNQVADLVPVGKALLVYSFERSLPAYKCTVHGFRHIVEDDFKAVDRQMAYRKKQCAECRFTELVRWPGPPK